MLEIALRVFDAMPSWMFILASALTAGVVFCVVVKIVRALGALSQCLDAAFGQYESSLQPIAYYTEYRGTYAVFLSESLHGEHEKRGYLTVVNPCLTFAPESEFSSWEKYCHHTGRVTDMIRLFHDWDLRLLHDERQYFVPCAGGRMSEDEVAEQLSICPRVPIWEAYKLLAAERDRKRKTALGVWWHFRMNVWMALKYR